MPEHELSLKMLFDNIQNYAVCTLIFVIAIAMSPRMHLVNPQERLSPFLLIGMLSLGVVLLILTALQSKALAELAYAAVKQHLLAKHGNRGIVGRLYVSTILAALVLALYVALMATIGIGLSTVLQGFLTGKAAP